MKPITSKPYKRPVMLNRTTMIQQGIAIAVIIETLDNWHPHRSRFARSAK